MEITLKHPVLSHFEKVTGYEAPVTCELVIKDKASALLAHQTMVAETLRGEVAALRRKARQTLIAALANYDADSEDQAIYEMVATLQGMLESKVNESL